MQIHIKIIQLAKKLFLFSFYIIFYYLQNQKNVLKYYIKIRRDEQMFDNTQKFVLKKDQDDEMKFILTEIYDALKSKGYNPISQIVGYILSEDPTYITNHNNARSLVRKLDRDELLHTLVRHYLSD